mmetsp:Transcript_321/g.626  ORF Transcript_321/g.626 Transcript_321/m.626 type:complete len:221 (-) Transcript_321:427-1089(-)
MRSTTPEQCKSSSEQYFSQSRSNVSTVLILSLAVVSAPRLDPPESVELAQSSSMSFAGRKDQSSSIFLSTLVFSWTQTTLFWTSAKVNDVSYCLSTTSPLKVSSSSPTKAMECLRATSTMEDHSKCICSTSFVVASIAALKAATSTFNAASMSRDHATCLSASSFLCEFITSLMSVMSIFNSAWHTRPSSRTLSKEASLALTMDKSSSRPCRRSTMDWRP